MRYSSRFQSYVGVLTPPSSFDYSAQMLWTLCADPIGVIQQVPLLQNFNFDGGVDGAEERLGIIRQGICAMRDAEAEVVAQAGGYWSLPFTPDLATAIRLEDQLSAEFNIPVLLCWKSYVDALALFGAKKVVVAAGYYRDAWTAAVLSFFQSAQIEVLWAGDLISQGILKQHSDKETIEARTRFDYPDELIFEACMDAARRAPDCDAVCQVGAGMRVGNVAHAVEQAIGKPVISTDTAFHWGVFKHCGLSAHKGYGMLLDSTI